MSKHAIRPGSARAWLLAARPATLSAAVIPVAVGCAVADAVVAIVVLPAIAALLGALWIQIGTNFANDLYDFKKGADTASRLGPTRTAQAGLLTPWQLLQGMFVAFGLATLCGLYLAFHSGYPIVLIGLASIAAGIGYTGGPYPLGYHGLGDIFVLVFFGFVAVCGTVYVQLGWVPELAVWASIPVGALATAILVVNNIRDADTDRLCGKRTLAVRFGRRAARIEYIVLLASAYIVPSWLVVDKQLDGSAALPLLTIPVAIALIRRVLTSNHPQTLTACLRSSAGLLLMHGALFSVGICLG